MQLEAAMCPMTMYELGKCQKLSAEMKSQLDTATSMNAYLSSQKNNLENQLSVSVCPLHIAENHLSLIFTLKTFDFKICN